MNKKVLTLCAGFLLAGGLFSTANAIDLRNAKAGQYYQLKRTAQFQNGTWSDAASTDYYLVSNQGKVMLEQIATPHPAIENTYWTIEVKENQAANVKSVRFVNVGTGKALSITNQAGNASTEWFEVQYHAQGTTLGTVSSLREDANELQWGAGLSNWLAVEGTSTFEATSAQSSEAVTTNNIYIQGLDAVAVPVTEMTVQQVNDNLKNNGFGLQIGYLDNGTYKDYTLVGGDAFVGTLSATADDPAISTDSENTLAQSFYIYNESQKAYVVLLKEKWSKNGTDLLTGDGKGYKFALKTAKQIIEDKAKAADKQEIISYKFNITSPSATGNAPLQVVVEDVYGARGKDDVELLVANVNNADYLTTAPATTTNDVNQEVADYAPKTYVKFGQSDLINLSDFYGYAITIEGTKGDFAGKTLRPAAWRVGYEWVNADYVALTRPEGQWIVTYTDEYGYTFTNRESKERHIFANLFVGLRHASGDIYVDANGNEYEIKKTEKLGGETFDHYGVFAADASDFGYGRSYKIAFDNKTTGTTNYVSINGKGDVVLTDKVENAINFDLQRTVTTDTMKNNGTMDANVKTDVFYIINNIMSYNDKDKVWEYKADADTLSFYRYNFVYDGKYLALDDDQLELTAKKADAGNFVVKAKDGEVVNVLNISNADYDDFTGRYYNNVADRVIGENILVDGEMLYFDFNHALLKQQPNIYDWEANAQLLIDDKNYATYRTLAAPDTMEFYRIEFEDEFLFENGKFLGMTYNRDKYNPAIYVDTAYVRNNTQKPLYMLAVDPEITPAKTYCPIHGENADCKDEHLQTIPAFVEARYLVSYTDSAAAHNEELKNEFIEDGKYTKLGFVQATHRVDSLYLPNDTAKTYTKWTLGQTMMPATFAFRIVDEATQDFIIESVQLADYQNGGLDSNNPYVTAWVKWHNGCPVLTTDIKDAEVFNVRETSLTPTANEEISAEEATVSVVATNGAVIVKGAEGKNVVVSTILGKVVANEVLNSDNETIAAPAGIVVVSVDGESFKVAVK